MSTDPAGRLIGLYLEVLGGSESGVPVALASGACSDSKLDQDNTNEKGKR